MSNENQTPETDAQTTVSDQITDAVTQAAPEPVNPQCSDSVTQGNPCDTETAPSETEPAQSDTTEAPSETMTLSEETTSTIVSAASEAAPIGNGVGYEELRAALENCRLYAAKRPKEEWARTILRFCADAGVTASPLRG
jgi:hypothetical protein